MTGNGQGLAFADYAVVACFFAVMIAVGLFFGRDQKSMAQFFGGGKQVPWWLSGISFYMCSFSALAFVMYSALAYKYGWLPVTVSWLSVPVVLLSGRVFAARWRRVAETSPLEYIERRYGNGMRQGLTWLGLPMQILDNAFKLLALGTVVGVGLGFPLRGAVIGSGLIILCYTFMGGLWAALVADFIQFFVMLTVILVLPFLCISKAGGLAAFVEAVPPGFFRLTADKYDWTYMLIFFMLLFFNYSTSWAMVQRYYSTRSEREVRKVRWLVAALLFVGPPLFFLPIMAARVFLPEIPEQQMNEVYAMVCKSVLPVGFFGMVVAAMFSATMSTLAGSYNAAASVLANDFYTRMVAPDASPRQQMVAARLGTLLIGLAVIGLTFVMQNAQGANDLFDITNKMFGVFLPPIAIPMMLGLVSRRISRRGGLAGLLGGIAVGAAVFILGAWWPGFRATGVIFSVTCAATLAGLFLGTALWPDAPDDEALARFFEKVDTPSPVLEGPPAKITFWPLVAGGLACIGLVLIGATLATRPFAEIRLSVGGGVGLLLAAGVFGWLSRRS
jgi:SSS family transporter